MNSITEGKIQFHWQIRQNENPEIWEHKWWEKAMKENRIHQLTGRTCIKIEFYHQRIDTVSCTLSSLTEKKMEMEKTKNRIEKITWNREHQFNDAMTEENFLLCSLKGKQMIYDEQPGSPAAIELSGSCRLRTCLPGTDATKYKSFLCQRRMNSMKRKSN